MTPLEEKIHEYVNGCTHAVNAHDIRQALAIAGETATLQEVRAAIASLKVKGFLVDADEPSYFAVC